MLYKLLSLSKDAAVSGCGRVATAGIFDACLALSPAVSRHLGPVVTVNSLDLQHVSSPVSPWSPFIWDRGPGQMPFEKEEHSGKGLDRVKSRSRSKPPEID